MKDYDNSVSRAEEARALFVLGLMPSIVLASLVSVTGSSALFFLLLLWVCILPLFIAFLTTDELFPPRQTIKHPKE